MKTFLSVFKSSSLRKTTRLSIFLTILFSLSSFAEEIKGTNPAVQSRIDFLINKKSTVEGPNCWNESTYVAGISKGIHHTSFNEFAFILDSPLCKQKTMEQAETGDIVAFRRFDREGKLLPASILSEVHGYTYIDSKMGLTKNGVMVEAVYEMMSHESIYQFYRKSEYNNCKMFGFDRGHCNMKAVVYHCQDMESFLAQKNGLNPQEQDLLNQITKLELQMHDMALSGNPLQLESNAIAQIETSIRDLESQGSSSFLIDYMDFRVNSVEQTQSP
jgi:hypothetical protein